MHTILEQIIQLYTTHGLSISCITKNKESSEYDAHSFLVNNKRVAFRHAKITPKKPGAFVTLWQRTTQTEIIKPYTTESPYEYYMIAISNQIECGHFIFPAEVLAKRHILTSSLSCGKLGFRVYAPWDTPTSKSAQATQAWQQDYFVFLKPALDLFNIKKFFSFLQNIDETIL